MAMDLGEKLRKCFGCTSYYTESDDKVEMKQIPYCKIYGCLDHNDKVEYSEQKSLLEEIFTNCENNDNYTSTKK